MADTFASALKSYMDRRDLSGPDLAARIGVSHQAVYTWLNGQRLPNRLAAESIARVLRSPDLVATVERDRERMQRARSGGVA